MRKQFLITALAGMLALGSAQAFAQTATVVMRTGDRMQVEVVDMGAAFTFRINGTERQVPINDVVLIDFAGNGRNIPPDEISRANAASANGHVVMRNGDLLTARLLDIHGVPSKGWFSGERDIDLSQIARIYLGSVHTIPDLAANTTNNGEVGLAQNTRISSRAPRRARTVVVPANVEWTNTGIRVKRGQAIRFEPSGEVRLSLNVDDVAVAAGAKNGRMAANAPIPSIYAGALIGRVNNGQPFSIGDPTQAFRMPADGTLFLMVNDDHVADNSGNLVVKIWEP
jgi:hypothetical protein